MTQLKSFAFNPFSENTYILFDDTTREAIVIDPGFYTDNERKMFVKYINDNQLIVKRLLNTHCHLDHIIGNPFIIETYGVGLECHRDELPVLNNAERVGAMYGVTVPPQLPPSVFIEDNAVIALGCIELKAILATNFSPFSHFHF